MEDLFDDIDHDEGVWRKGDDLRFPKTLAQYHPFGKSSNKTSGTKVAAIEALNIEGNTALKDKIAEHLTLKKKEGQSNFKLKTVIAHELSENPDEFEEIAKEIIGSYNEQHTLKAFGKEEE